MESTAAKTTNDILLDVKDLNIRFKTKKGYVNAVEHLDFHVKKGELLALVGESGCGKSVTSLAVMDLIERPGEVKAESMMLDGHELTTTPPNEKRKMRGTEMAMIFQDPLTSLNPLYTIGNQLSEQFLTHIPGCTKQQAKEKSIEIIRKTGIPRPEAVYKSYPHELSGGMRQRVMIAMALACQPKLLIADEPTTALDVTIQAQILKLMNDLKREHGTSILFITHDLGVICQMADDVAVMYCGQVVEMAPARTIFGKPQYSHPYTEGLMVSIPRLDTPANERLDAIPGAVPHPLDLPKGCKFAPRCKYCTKRCEEEEPEFVRVSETQQIRCFYPEKEARHASK